MKDNNRRARHGIMFTLCAAFGSAGCVIEKIDAIIAEHGVTYWPSSYPCDKLDLVTRRDAGRRATRSHRVAVLRRSSAP